MIRLLRLLVGAPANPSQLADSTNGAAGRGLPELNDIPMPEVVEGDGGESDWNMWQDSVLQLDSQLQALTTQPSSLDKTQPLSSDELSRYARGQGH